MPGYDRPFQFRPLLMTRVWGGERLLARRDPVEPAPTEPVGESWEVVDRDDAQSVVRGGPYMGRTLRDLFAADRDALAGRGVDPANPDVFPLMLKLLDARDDLSVQVHPDDAYAAARRPGELGKTEAWYVLDADADARIYRGFVDGVDRAAFARALADPTGRAVAPCLKALAARGGDVFHLPAGTVHALGAGVRIAEIQQNSDTTYRVFDWNRAGLDGRPRALHVDDALAVADFARRGGPDRPVATPLPADGCRGERLVADGKFVMDRFAGFSPDGAPMRTDGGFHLWLCLAGEADIGVREDGRAVPMRAWDHALVPASMGGYAVHATADAALLRFQRPAGR